MDDTAALSYLKTLKKNAQSWLDCAKQKGVRGPINWADLHVTAAERVLDDEGGCYFRVTISEADPMAQELRDHVRNGLECFGYNNVEVVTEW